MRLNRFAIGASIGAVLILGTGGAVAYHHFTGQPASKPATSQQPATSGGTSGTHPSQPKFDKTQHSTTDPASPWVVVNKQHPLNPLSYAPTDLTNVGNSQQMRAEAAAALQHMFADAQAAGFTLVADSGYRSYSTQVSTYNSIVKGYGATYADTVSAHPGYSEHQTGWAVDIGTGSCHVQDCFADTPGGKWAQTNAHTYGFILRYPPSLTSITGYSNEAWHFRYVGPLLAGEMHTEGKQTLEQFFDIPGGTTYK
jgi:D-alanyl-D-alanine carboxypeptidase